MKKILYLSFVLILIPYLLNAQRWKKERMSIVAGTGMSHFMGDLGGGKKDAAHFFGVRDLDFVTTRPNFQVGFRYRILEELAVKPSLTYALLAAKDAASGADGRMNRNLEFRSHVWELGVQLEYAFIKEKQNPRYSFASLSAMRNISAFVILGGGAFYYNPKAEYNGDWVALRPLHTEGQGQASYTYTEAGITEEITPDAEYGIIAGQFTLGLGMKYNLNRVWSIGLEITNRFSASYKC